MTESALPMSRSALDRLGERLKAADRIAEDDLNSLAAVVDAYQRVLDDVKDQLTTLGYAATTRVKTTGTLVEKLRREDKMLLSRVQDLAGARIIVADRPAQDDAVGRIREHFEAVSQDCRVVDRRRSPSHGYRAVHVIVKLRSVQVEIQVRTDLEDTWAQIVERLADRWGRGIRYGGDPIDPEAEVRAGQLVFSRRQAVAYLIELGAAIDSFEVLRGMMMVLGQAGRLMARLVQYADQLPQAADPRLIAELPESERAGADIMVAGATLIADQEQRAAIDPQNMTMAQVFRIVSDNVSALTEESAVMLAELPVQERELRDTLQMIASASAEGSDGA